MFAWLGKNEKVYNFNAPVKKEAWRLKHGHHLRFKEKHLTAFNRKYQWDKKSLLLNMKLNPVTDYAAAMMLRRYLELSKVKKDELAKLSYFLCFLGN